MVGNNLGVYFRAYRLANNYSANDVAQRINKSSGRKLIAVNVYHLETGIYPINLSILRDFCKAFEVAVCIKVTASGVIKVTSFNGIKVYCVIELR